MPNLYRVQLYWTGRNDTLELMTRQVQEFLSGVSGVHPSFGPWMFRERSTKAWEPVSGEEVCRAALVQARVKWGQNGQLTAYQPRFVVTPGELPALECQLTCGMTPMQPATVFVPNRVQLLLRGDLPNDAIHRGTLVAILRSAVEAFQPLWGTVGDRDFPQPSPAIFSEGIPTPGWMTYLSNLYRDLPITWPTPIVSYPVKPHGTLIVAHPKLYDPNSAEQNQAIELVRSTLEQAGVLVPPHRLSAAAQASP